MLLCDVVVYFLTLIISVYGDDRNSCAVAGYTPLLKCASCTELKKFKLEKIEASCLRCCEDESVPGMFKVSSPDNLFCKKYAFAELVACS
ncbi:unnamed protein product [Heterobilharzia americana]|nr:unnamed protein product [Heterobilharzia americana]